MKLRELLNELEIIKKIAGDDIEVVVSSDSEGNSFGTISHGCFSYVHEKEDDFVKAQRAGCLSGNVQDVINKFFKNAKTIGICIYPWEEGFESAEQACKADEVKEEMDLNRKIAYAENRMDAAKETGEML